MKVTTSSTGFRGGDDNLSDAGTPSGVMAAK
jgi:hypothetical protein